MAAMSTTSLATASKFFIRGATARDMEFVTRQMIKEGRPVGPYDFPSAYASYPKGFFVGEVDGKVVGHASATTYPNHHSHMGGFLVAEEHRGKGYGHKLDHFLYDILDKSSIGIDTVPKFKGKFEARGFRTFWNTYVAMLSLEKITRNLAGTELPSSVFVEPIHSVNLEKLLEYDSFVFGTSRRLFIERWINIPGSFGWAAINRERHDIVGYAILKQVIRGAGTEIGLAMAPLFADNVQIAKLLFKTAAENCLANEAVPNTMLGLFHPVGDNCGEQSSQLMTELEAELTHIVYRMYSKGIPSGRQLRKIYGIASTSFD